jgi:hypothetical protein
MSSKKINSENKIKYNNNMNTFKDKVSVKNAKYIYNLDFNTFKATFWDKNELDQTNKKWDLKVYFNSVRKYCQEIIRAQKDNEPFSILKKTYHYSGNNKAGRIYVSGFGIQSLQNKLRKFLTGDYLVDIDIKNCHYNILYKLVLEYNKTHEEKLNCQFLESYCLNRSKILQQHKLTKMILLVCLNSDEVKTNKKEKGFYTKNDFLKGLHIEKMIIFNNLINNTNYFNNIRTDNELNPISSLVNKLLCIKENEIIQSVIKSKICVPMFDGFMFPIEEKEKYDYLLEEKDIIQWEYKENIIHIDLSTFDEENSKDYETLKKKFEEEHFMVYNPTIFVKKIKNSNNIKQDVFFDFGKLSTILAPLKVLNEEGKQTTFLMEWLEDEDRRHYECMDFNPYIKKELDITPNHVYNNFEEFESSIVEYTKKDIEWFEKFLLYNLADGNYESYKYLLNYIADLIQRPYYNNQISLVLKGESGIGKDTLIEIIERLYGKSNDYVYRTANIDDILPKNGFNSGLKNKLLVQFNEVEGKDSNEAKERIKDHITRGQNIIKQKYIDEFKQKNLAHIIFCSNNNSPVTFAYDERRFALFKCGSKNKGNTEYWNEIYNNINNKDKLNQLYSYLLNHDLSNWKPVDDRPKNKAYMIALSNAMPHHIRWLKELFIDEKDIKYVFNYDEKLNIYYCNTKTLYNHFNSWATENHLISEGTFKSLAFKKQLQEINGITFDKTIRINKIISKKVIMDKDEIIHELNKYEFNINNEDDEILDLS